MCGICGLAGRGVINEDLQAFKDLFFVTSLRGPHSTGLYTYTTGGDFKKEKHRLSKSIGPAPYWLARDANLPLKEKMIRTVWSDVIMGHCRWATAGAVTDANAHPFDTGNLVGAHNGTLYDLKYNMKDETRTDSEMMFLDMEKRGVVPVLESLSYGSAWAISVFDKKREVLTLGRNDERPLFIARSNERSVLYWASEVEALELCLTRDKRKFDMEYLRLEPNYIYEIPIKDISARNETPWTATKIVRKPVYRVKSTSETSTTMTLPWGEDDIPAFMTAKDPSCSDCGQILYGNSKWSAHTIEVNGKIHFTCAECYESAWNRRLEKKEA